MGTAQRTSLRTIAGLVFTVICLIHAFVDIFINIFSGNGFGLLSSIVAVTALLGLLITALRYHDSEDMDQWPVIFMCLYLISNLFLIFGSSWTYALMLLPLAALILLVTVFHDWGVMGITAGVLMILLTIVGGMIIFHSNMAVSVISVLSGGKISSMYLASLLVSNNCLMGIACICFFCSFPSTTSYGDPTKTGLPPEDTTGGFV